MLFIMIIIIFVVCTTVGFAMGYSYAKEKYGRDDDL